jgi:hypothetical protein
MDYDRSSYGLRMISSAVNEPDGRNSYPVAPNMTVIPAQAGIHRGERTALPIGSELPDYVLHMPDLIGTMVP